MYLEQRGASIEDEVSKHLETLYAKNVPAGVREFIDMKSVNAPRRKPAREHRSEIPLLLCETQSRVADDVAKRTDRTRRKDRDR